MKRIINSIYLPITLSSNKYVDIVQNAMKNSGITISGLKECINPNKLKNIDVVNLNWFESRVDKKSLTSSICRYVLYSLLLKVFKLYKIKIVTTMHNSITHDVHHKTLSAKFYKKVLMESDAIICMNRYTYEILDEMGGEQLTQKGYYIPHPSYYGSYEEDKIDGISLAKNQFNLLFMGLVRPYKNIELILEIAKDLKDYPIHFYICGFAENEEYGQKIKELANSDNVTVQLKFFKDSEMVDLIKKADAVLLPYSNVSSLNSGAAILAFSYGTTAIGTLNGTMREFESDLIYGYNYKNSDEHYSNLKNSILRAYNDYSANREKYEKKGIDLQEKVNTEWNPEVIGKLYYDLYIKLIDK